MSVVTFATLAACTSNVKQPLTSGLDLSNMDSTYLPGSDFYMYATGGWQKSHPLTPEYSRYGSFDVLTENNNERLRTLIEEVAAKKHTDKNSVEYKIAALYNTAMDSVKLNKDGQKTLHVMLAVDGYQQTAEITDAWLQRCWKQFQRQGVPGLFGFYVGADAKDSKNNILQLYQGGMIMPQRDYYLEQDSATLAVRKAYVDYIKQMTVHAGFQESEAARIADDVMRIETRMAKVARTNVQLRDPEANYNKMTYDSLKATFAGIDWDDYFANFGISGLKEVIVGQPEAIREAEMVMREEKPEALQNYYLWHVINMSANYVDDESRAISFNFWGKAMSGKQEDKPRWKRAVAEVEDVLGDAVGQIYVQRYFPQAAKDRMLGLVANLQKALGERIDAQDWMS
ncbi:MAG: M13 family peptidase, partial [Bacteroidaceae bacterium]|nr:M13 family peptidase [Bacteroidaceae bacterium]